MNANIAYHWRKQLVWGILLIVLGCAILLDRAGIVDFDFNLLRSWHYWPWLVVISGVIQIVPPTTPRHLLSGLWQIFAAAWWYVSFERVWGWGFGETWPALLVAWGVGLMLRPLLDNLFATNREQK